MSPVTCFVGGMYLIGQSGKSSRMRSASAHSSTSCPGRSGSISKACPSPIWASGMPAASASARFTSVEATTVWPASCAAAVVR